jgi:hypothetical protein
MTVSYTFCRFFRLADFWLPELLENQRFVDTIYFD